MLRSQRWLVAVFVCFSVSGARADSLECEGRRISAGDTKVDLLGKCGEPSAREERVEIGRASCRERV